MKKEVFEAFSKAYPVSSLYEKWGKEEILAFQEDLFQKVKTKVSEKWFYTYFKNTPDKLPRIDMLNLLSQYIGFQNWNEFKDKKKKPKKKKIAWVVPILIIPLSLIFFSRENEFHFCFIDEDKRESINTILDVEVLTEKETPIYLQTNDSGCFSYTTRKKKVKMIVRSTYYKTDTIIRYSDNLKNIIHLSLDDYSIMLDYYTNGKIKDVNTRKKQLSKLIHENAIIYQVYSKEIGVEVYSKEEFINLLTIPTQGLKKIKFLSKEFSNDKIMKLKFIMQ